MRRSTDEVSREQLLLSRISIDHILTLADGISARPPKLGSCSSTLLEGSRINKDMKTNLNLFLEAEDSILKDATNAANKFKKEFTTAFKNKTYELSVSSTGKSEVTVTVKINHFLADCKEDRSEFDSLTRDLKDFMSSHSGALKVTDEGFFAGPIASSLIKPGKKIDADALLSQVIVILTYAANFK